MPLGIGGPPDQGGGEDAFATGLLAGAGLREISQVLGLSRKRQGSSGAQPSASTMLQGQMGDLDRVMLLARIQSLMGGPGGGPMGPGLPGAAPPMPGAMLGAMPGALPPGAGPLPFPSPLARPPMPPMVPPGPLPMPGGLPLPTPAMPGPQGGAMGGGLPIILLKQMLSGAAGPV